MEHDELAQHLESLQRESCYRVDAILKESPVEITQRVYFVGNGAESGPYIRKFIKQGFGMGSAYESIYKAQQDGFRFKYLPDILECYMRDDKLVVVMECVRGETLQEAVYERDPSLELATEVFPKLCDAVGELHSEFNPPIIHRDLKPSNIILTGQGLVLIDFGISREYHEGAEADTTHFGTREFAPPEQFGFSQTTVKSDIYSLGMVLYFCLTEEIPNAQARNQGFRNPKIPEDLRLVIERAVALDPAMRFGSAEELKRAFLAAADKSVDSQRTGSQASQADAGKGGRKGGKAKVFAVAAAIIIACIALVIGLLQGSKTVSTDQQGISASSASSASAAGDSHDDESMRQADSLDSPSGSSSGSSSDSATTVAAESLAADIKIQAPPRNGFDPTTNEIVKVAGVEFQIPRYFMANTSESGGFHYYYAEMGTSVAMIMTGETPLDESTSRADFEAQKDDYLSGIMEADGMEEVTASVDCELAGLSTRIVTITGTVKGLTTSSKAAYFFEPDSHTVGVIILGQTDNAQFDYASDFAKTIASAKRA